ncbi:MAG: transposase, partial [Bacteroidales bacterium]|nr:transposase [Bacteroidales bacterium]
MWEGIRVRVPRVRGGAFYPLILGILKQQEEEAREIAFELYGAGLTTRQVGTLFERIYGREYSTSQVSRMFDYARGEIKAWL